MVQERVNAMTIILIGLTISNLLAWRALYYAHYSRKWFGNVRALDEAASIGLQEAYVPTLRELPKYFSKGRRVLWL